MVVVASCSSLLRVVLLGVDFHKKEKKNWAQG
jgi:hypothetical protein